MKSWLFALGLALCCTVRADDLADDLMPVTSANISKLEGPWYGVGLATTCQQLKNMAQSMPVLPLEIHSVKDKEFQLKMNMRMPNEKGCKVINQHVKEENGSYTTSCRYATKTMGYMRTDYTNFIFISMKVTSDGKNSCDTVSCLSKNPSEDEDFLHNCGAFARRMGLDENSVQELRTEGMCKPPQ